MPSHPAGGHKALPFGSRPNSRGPTEIRPCRYEVIYPEQGPMLRSCSQPLASTPSQSAKPTSQDMSVHHPLAQDSLALGKSQVTPHQPQSVRVVNGVSHPKNLNQSGGSPVQNPYPCWQPAIWHLHPSHSTITFCGPQHISPQMPQFVTDSTDVSHPLAGSASQFKHLGYWLSHIATGSWEQAWQGPVPRSCSQPLASIPSQSAK